jgi:prephenate dehydratase
VPIAESRRSRCSTLPARCGWRSKPTTASRRAAALYDAAIIAEHIQDRRDNWTRFLLLSSPAQTTPIADPQKALVAFGLKHEPGALVHALQPIANAGLSITKIEGRPAGHAFEYHFVVEMVGAAGGPIPAVAFQELKAATTWLKVLGAFRL